MSTDIKLSKAQLSKIIQSGGFLGALLGKFASPLVRIAVSLAKNVLSPLATMASASAVDVANQRKMRKRAAIATSRAGVVRAGREITFVISNVDMDDIITSIKSLENSCVLIDEVSETVKHEIKNKKMDFLVCY